MSSAKDRVAAATLQLIAIVFHWWKHTSPHGQFGSPWPPVHPARADRDGESKEFWIEREHQLDLMTADAEALQTTHRFGGCFDAHVRMLRRPAGLLVGPEAFEGGAPRSADELGVWIAAHLALIRAGSPMGEQRAVAIVDGRALVHLWAMKFVESGVEPPNPDYLLRVREAANSFDLYLSVHDQWARRCPAGWDENVDVFSGRQYLSVGQLHDGVTGAAPAALRPGFWSHYKLLTERGKPMPWLPRHGGRHYRAAWRALAAARPLPGLVWVVLDEEGEGSQVSRCRSRMRHTATEPAPTPHSWQHAAVDDRPEFAVARDDHWGVGSGRFLLMTRRGMDRVREAALTEAV